MQKLLRSAKHSTTLPSRGGNPFCHPPTTPSLQVGCVSAQSAPSPRAFCAAIPANEISTKWLCKISFTPGKESGVRNQESEKQVQRRIEPTVSNGLQMHRRGLRLMLARIIHEESAASTNSAASSGRSASSSLHGMSNTVSPPQMHLAHSCQHSPCFRDEAS